MNLPALAPQWLVFILLGLLTLAAIEDAIRCRISNFLSGAVLVSAVVAIALAGPSLALWENLLIFAAVLIVGTMLFSAGKLGGGDIKLLAATALWFDLSGALRLVAAVTIAGGLLAIIILVIRNVVWRRVPQPEGANPPTKGGIPYGIAIAAGAATAALTLHTPSKPYNPLEAPIPRLEGR